MYIRWFAVVFIVSLLYACSPYNGGGELTGTRKTKKWFEPQQCFLGFESHGESHLW